MHVKPQPLHIHLFLVFPLTFLLCCCALTQTGKTAKDENTAAYQYELAAVALKYGLEDEAVKYLTHGLTLEPNHQPSLFLLASLHLNRKNYAEAEEEFLRSLAIKPDDAEARTRLGMVYRESGAPDKAEEEFLKAYDLQPSLTATLNLAQHFFDSGRLEKSLEYADLALGKSPRSVPGMNLRGVILNRLNRHAEAAASFETVLSWDPENIVSAFNLAATYISLYRREEARQILEKLLPRVQDPRMRETILETLETIGKPPGTEEDAERRGLSREGPAAMEREISG